MFKLQEPSEREIGKTTREISLYTRLLLKNQRICF